jgi:hypothetical protein
MFWNALSRRMPALFTNASRRPQVLIAVSIMPDGVIVRDRLAAGGFDLGDDLIGDRAGAAAAVNRAAGVVHHDLGAAGGQQQRVLLAKPRSGAGNDGDAVVESNGH